VLELRIKLQEKQKELRRAIDNYPIVFFGGARGGGKSYALRNIFLLRCLETPKRNSAIFRKTHPELDSNHIRPLFQEHPGLRPFYNDSKKLLSLPNGSTLRFAYCENDKDVHREQGQEIHDMGIDELGAWSESVFRTLLGSNRSSNAAIKPRFVGSGNPGGVGHSWIKRLFIERRFNNRERPEDYYFIQSLISDNTALMEADPDYVYRLKSETNETLRKAYLEGDWDLLAGQYFGELRREIHFIKPFHIPSHWNRFGAYDFGFRHPAAFGWFANDEDGNTYLYRELVKAQMRVDQFARELNRFEDTANLYPIVAGHDCWTVKGVLKDTAAPPTVAEEFASHGISLKRATIDRIQGASHLRSYLAWQGRTNEKPRFYIFDTCPIAFDTLSRMIHDPDRVEDVLKVDATEGDPLSGDDCFAAGTLIATANGQKPIEDIEPGELVWTRDGIKPVVDAWLNRMNSPTVKLTLSDGRSVVSTPNHKIWDGKAFSAADTLRYGMTISCLSQKQLYSQATSSVAILNLSTNTLETITGLLEISPSEALDRCMSRYGKQLTALYPKGITFTTKMGIHSTTAWRTWSRSFLRIMLASISRTRSEWLQLESILNAFGPSLLPGIGAPLVESGTVKMLYAPMLNEKGSRHVVWSAPENLLLLIQRKLSSAIQTADNGTARVLIAEPQNVSFARRHSTIALTALRPELAVLNVEQICDGGKRDTYSLHVADTHEYFANGILVSNCYDMVRYGLMSRPAITDKLTPKLVHGSREWYEKQAEINWAQEREKLIEGQGEWPEIPQNPWGTQ
jgi:phage terminase large subunit